MKAPHGLADGAAGCPQPRAFTLIEMLVVISIILFLAVILTVAAMKAVEGAKLKKTHARLNTLAHALTEYYTDFHAFPPADTTADHEWWRYLSMSGDDYQRPVKFDGTIREMPYLKEADMGLPASGAPRLPKDGWNSDIEYVFPVDNDAANITPHDAASDPSIPTMMRTMSQAQAYYHCVLISPGKDRLPSGPSAQPGRVTNNDDYEGDPKNIDNLVKTVGGR